MIVAPAGYGKTSLATQWHDVLKTPDLATVWITLEAEDCDQSRFLIGLLDGIRDILPDEAKGLDASSMPVSTLLSVLMTRLRRVATPVVLFLDDYHFAQTDATESLVAKLLAAPDLVHVKVVLISRSAPRFPVSALRLEGELMHIGVADLGFSGAEAQEFFAGLAAKLTREQIDELNQRTEGWAVALQMVRILVNESTESDSILSSLDGSNAEMGRYLSEQVFASLPVNIRRLLIETAALPAVSRDLAKAVSDQPDAAVLFNQLRDYALPIAVLDGQGSWFRYHPVFNGFLREEAERLGIDMTRGLRAAARWFEAGKDHEAAVRHALLGRDPVLAARIIEAAGGWRLVYATTRGGTALFQTLAARAADINLLDFPLTTLGLAVVSAKAGQLDVASHYLAIAERAFPSGGERLGRDLRVVRVLLFLYTDRWASASDLSALEADLSKDAEMGLIHRALALNMLSYNFLIRTDLDRALHYGQLARQAFHDGGADFGAMHLHTHIGQAALFSGDSASAADAYRNLIDEAQKNIGKGSDLDAVGQVLQSELLSLRGECEAASSALSWALPHLERHDTWFDLLAAGFITQQRIFRLSGDVLAAHAGIDGARAAARRRGFDRLTRLIDGERVMLLIASGDVQDAIRYAGASGFGEQMVNSDGANNFAVHLRGSVPALLWVRLHLAVGDVSRARTTFDGLMTRQAQKPHVPRRIELGFLEILLLLAEDESAVAAAKLSEMLLSLPVADYRAILQVEGRAFSSRLAALAATAAVPNVVSQRLAQLHRRSTNPAKPIDGRLDGGLGPDPERGPDADVLTDRERSVIRLLSTGLGNKEIGRKLDLSDNTVKFHLRNIYAKLNVSTRTAAVMAARDTGMLS